jgi:hypothetical protein
MSQPATVEAPATTTVQDRRSEFVPVGPGGETTSAEALLIMAYLLMWAFIFVLLGASLTRQSKLDARLSELEAALQKRDGGPAKDEALV